ncbi:MAG: hypothetical protein IKL57_00495 [Oscillospiraceae bacterium]|nr:hypothetical protein [Oscillospiraceae bacterium]
MKRIIILFLSAVIFLSGCGAEKNEPGNAFPVMVRYEGITYFHRGKVIFELPADYEKIGAINCVEALSIEKDLDGNEEGYLYRNEEGDYLFEYKDWNESKDGGKEPFLVLVPEE